MTTWTTDWVEVGRHAEARAAEEVCECGSQKVVGYSNMGIPVVVCPVCSSSLVANRHKPVGEAWGYEER